jgi:hypothetical protein
MRYREDLARVRGLARWLIASHGKSAEAIALAVVATLANNGQLLRCPVAASGIPRQFDDGLGRRLSVAPCLRLCWPEPISEPCILPAVSLMAAGCR